MKSIDKITKHTFGSLWPFKAIQKHMQDEPLHFAASNNGGHFETTSSRLQDNQSFPRQHHLALFESSLLASFVSAAVYIASLLH